MNPLSALLLGEQPPPLAKSLTHRSAKARSRAAMRRALIASPSVRRTRQRARTSASPADARCKVCRTRRTACGHRRGPKAPAGAWRRPAQTCMGAVWSSPISFARVLLRAAAAPARALSLSPFPPFPFSHFRIFALAHCILRLVLLPPCLHQPDGQRRLLALRRHLG